MLSYPEACETLPRISRGKKDSDLVTLVLEGKRMHFKCSIISRPFPDQPRLDYYAFLFILHFSLGQNLKMGRNSLKNLINHNQNNFLMMRYKI